MSSKIFVGGLPYATDNDRLREGFEEFGTVLEATVITDRDGESRGFGFVKFQDANSAEKARQAMDGEEFDGRKINVDFARDREEGGGGHSSRYSQGGR